MMVCQRHISQIFVLSQKATVSSVITVLPDDRANVSNGINSNAHSTLNLHIPPVFASGESSRNSVNNSLSINTTVLNFVPLITGVHLSTTRTNVKSTQTTLDFKIPDAKQSTTKRSTSVQPREFNTTVKSNGKPTTVKQNTVPLSSRLQPIQTNIRTKPTSTEATSAFINGNNSMSLYLSTPTISSAVHQTENTSSSVLIPLHENVTDEQNATDNTSNYSSTAANVTSSTATSAFKNTTTRDPFDNNSPWHIPRSTYEPKRNGSRETQTKTTPIDDYDKGDTFWPVAMALTIGVPTIIVFAVTITVLYRRRMNKPRGLLGVYGTDYQSM